MKTECIILAVVCIVVGGLIAFAWFKRAAFIEWIRKPETRETIAKLCREAEYVIVGSKLGQERLAWVVKMLYRYVPPNIIMFIPEEVAVAVMFKMIQMVFDQISVILEDGTRRAV